MVAFGLNVVLMIAGFFGLVIALVTFAVKGRFGVFGGCRDESESGPSA
jgi:hypothetical protein